jgi:hypothetical protein
MGFAPDPLPAVPGAAGPRTQAVVVKLAANTMTKPVTLRRIGLSFRPWFDSLGKVV